MSVKYAWKILGGDPLWVSGVFTAAFLVLCGSGGDDVNWGYLGFEVLFPFYGAVVTGEWCRTRTDPMFDVIAAQGRSLFGWVAGRYALLFGMVAVFAAGGMVGVSVIRGENLAADLLITFFPGAFLLSSLSLFVSLSGAGGHVPAMTAGVVWLASILGMSLVRFAPVRWVYLFLRYAGIDGTIIIANKCALTLGGAVLWGGIALLCRRPVAGAG